MSRSIYLETVKYQINSFVLPYSILKSGENFTDSASSTYKFMFKLTEHKLRREVNLGVLELKLDGVGPVDTRPSNN